MSSKTYNHAFDIAFSMENNDPDGHGFTAEQIKDAIIKRVNQAYRDGELHESIGAPFDTYECE